MLEPGKIHHVWHHVEGDLAWYMHTHWNFTERINRDGKTVWSSKLELPGIDMLAQDKTARNVNNINILVTFCVLARSFEWCMCHTKSLPPDVTHVMEFYQAPSFFCVRHWISCMGVWSWYPRLPHKTSLISRLSFFSTYVVVGTKELCYSYVTHTHKEKKKHRTMSWILHQGRIYIPTYIDHTELSVAMVIK